MDHHPIDPCQPLINWFVSEKKIPLFFVFASCKRRVCLARPSFGAELDFFKIHICQGYFLVYEHVCSVLKRGRLVVPLSSSIPRKKSTKNVCQNYLVTIVIGYYALRALIVQCVGALTLLKAHDFRPVRGRRTKQTYGRKQQPTVFP